MAYMCSAVQDKKLYPAPFSVKNLECLLEQFCSRKLVQLLPSTAEFAADIWQRTMGHRGLSILCCSELEELMVQRSTLELDVWQKHAFEGMIQAAAGQSTYERLLHDLADLPDLSHGLLERVRRSSSFISESATSVVRMGRLGGQRQLRFFNDLGIGQAITLGSPPPSEFLQNWTY